jgi:hypothetical protein
MTESADALRRSWETTRTSTFGAAAAASRSAVDWLSLTSSTSAWLRAELLIAGIATDVPAPVDPPEPPVLGIAGLAMATGAAAAWTSAARASAAAAATSATCASWAGKRAADRMAASPPPNATPRIRPIVTNMLARPSWTPISRRVEQPEHLRTPMASGRPQAGQLKIV